MTADERNIEMQQAALEEYGNKRKKRDKLLKDNDDDRTERQKQPQNPQRIDKHPCGLKSATRSKKVKRSRIRNNDGDDFDNPIANIIANKIGPKKRKLRKGETRVIEPVQQIAPSSYLERALGGGEKQAHPSSESSDSSSRSSDSDSSSTYDSSSPDDNNSDETSESDTSTEGPASSSTQR